MSRGALRTLKEAATELHKSKRWLQDWIAENPVDHCGRPFCSRLGRTRLFQDSDLSRILEATRGTPCPSKSSRRVKAKARTIQSGGNISASLWIEAQELLKSRLQISNSRNLKPRSNVV